MDRAVIHCFVEATIEFRLSKTLTLFYYIRVTMGLYVKVFTGLYRSFLWIKSIYMYVCTMLCICDSILVVEKDKTGRLHTCRRI